MIVSIDTRLASMLSAMNDAIVPALSDNAFAAEQAQLVTAHLQVLLLQSEYAEEYERLEYRYLRALASDIAREAEGGVRTTRAAALLNRLTTQCESSSIRDVREAHSTLGHAIAAYIEEEGEDGSAESLQRTSRAVLRAEHAQAQRDRSFNSPFGYEDTPDAVDSIEDMMRTFRAEFPDEPGLRA
jgi:hypothetical protein